MSAGYGACLINKPELVKDMVRHVRNQVDNPNYTASIKIRYKEPVCLHSTTRLILKTRKYQLICVSICVYVGRHGS